MVNLPQSNSRTQAAKIVNVSGKTIQTAIIDTYQHLIVEC